jgi:hypothetical protein
MLNEQDASGEVHKVDYPENYQVKTASTAFTVEDMDKVIGVGTDALVMTLPAVGTSPDSARAGSKITFLNVGADGNNLITIAPNAVDAIIGTIANAAVDSVSGGVIDKDFVNTKATSNKGDFVTLISDGADGWYIIAGVGIWASEA